MSLLTELKKSASDVQAANQLQAQARMVQDEKDRQARSASLDEAGREAAKPLIAAAIATMKDAAAKSQYKADIFRLPASESPAGRIAELDRYNARAFTGATRGLALWAIDEQIRFKVETRDNGKWCHVQAGDAVGGLRIGDMKKLEGYEEWLMFSVSWGHEPTTADSQRQTEQRETAKKVGLGVFLDHLTLRIRTLAADPKITAEQRADIDHHIRWSKKIHKDDVESAAISIIAAANALGIKLEDELPR